MVPSEMDGETLNVRKMIRENTKKNQFKKRFEKVIPVFLLLIASVSIFTTAAIIYILVFESFKFFQIVPILDFFTGTVLKPLSATPSFGVLPLLMGTFTSSFIAILVALPIGLLSAIYLSEYAPKKVSEICKPILELLAGIPTIVYGFFAFTFVTPILKFLLPELEATNILSPGIVMGVMITPMIASLSEDAMRSVPNHLREGALAMGSTRLEVIIKIIIPSAISGIIASIVLAISRAIGETMIVTIASGSTKSLTFDVTQSMQTMTAYIVEVTGGDAPAGSTIYYSLYAVALTLFTFTFLMNLIANYISKKYKAQYE